MSMREKPGRAKIRNRLSVIDRLLMALLILLASVYIFYGVANGRTDSKDSGHLASQPAHKSALASSTPKTSLPSPTPALPASTPSPTPPPAPQIEPGDWPDYLLDNSSYNAGEIRITTQTVSALHLMWTEHAQGGVTAQPVVVDGMVYWGSWDGYEHATTLDGQRLWSTYLGVDNDAADDCDPDSAGVASTATIAPLNINGQTMLVDLVGGGDSSLYALNAANGHILWKDVLGDLPADFIWDSPALYDGNIYIGISSFGDCPSVQGKLFQIQATTGQVQNVFSIAPDGCQGGTQWGSPAIDESTGEVYIATGNLGLCASGEPYAMALVELQAATLQVIGAWQVPQSEMVGDGDSDFGSTPTLFSATINGATRQMVGAINKNGIFYAFVRGALGNGPVWQDQIARGPDCSTCDGAGTIAPAAWDGTRLYIGGGNTTIGGNYCEGSLRALDPSNGHFVWEHCLGDARAMAALAVVPGVVVVGEGHYVTAVDAGTGDTLFEFQDNNSGSIFYGAPSIADAMLFIGNMDGNLYAFEYYRTIPSRPE
ncbi:MAG: PQQ-binding-like beta-propeller repeat protein [Ktedonobacteraceae bacterium]